MQFKAAPIQPQTSAGPLPFVMESQSEDCLYLNVWTPSVAPTCKLPVIVWFHPGAYQVGSGSQPLWQGSAWARDGAVFVSFNHRLGKLGFLAHPGLCNESDEGVAGNYGLMDQLAVLRWVRDNIEAFGGDPDCVTIFGISAGATSVSLLMAMPAAQGLFHRAIAESGGSFGPVGSTTGLGDRWQALEAAVASGDRWAHETAKASSIDDLRSMSGQEICRLGKIDPNSRQDLFSLSRPIIDGCVVPENSYACFARADQLRVPLLVGSAESETMGMGSSLNRVEHLARAYEEFGPRAEQFLELYPASSDEEAGAASQSADGDRLFTWQNYTMAHLHSAADCPTYYYRFEQAPPVAHDAANQAFHCASIFYSFEAFGLRPDWNWRPEDKAVSQMVRQSWIGFARIGNPTCEAIGEWPRFDTASSGQMRLRSRPVPNQIGRKKQIGFWDDHYARQRQDIFSACADTKAIGGGKISPCN